MTNQMITLLLLLLTYGIGGYAIRVYTYPIEPSQNPDFNRYPIVHPDLSVIKHPPEFATLRDLQFQEGKLVNYEHLLQQFCLDPNTTLGHLVWPGDASLLFASNYREFIDLVSDKGLYITSIHGFTPVGVGFDPPPEVLQYLKETLGSRWFGMSTGEQDGHYYGALVWEELPLNLNHQFQYLHFRDYFRGLEEVLGPRLTTLMSSTFPHYEVKSGHYTMAGAETSQHGPNAQLRYAFIRGAGKQYGLLWYGNVSIYNRWGHKIYISPTTKSTSTTNDYANYTCSSNQSYISDTSGPLCGTSLNLMKRLLYAQIIYGSSYVSIERGWFYVTPSQQLSPIGLLQHNAYIWSKRVNSFGVHIAPIALYLDFFSGWASPRLKRGYEYHVWNNLPYSAGDYLTDGILRLIYPRYQDASYFHDETGISSSTPYGDGLDVILSDATTNILQQYDTLLVGSKILGGIEIEINLKSYVISGGNLVITAENLHSLPRGLLGVNVSDSCLFLNAGANVILNTGDVIIEPYNMTVCGLSYPHNASVLASLDDETPLVVSVTLEKGGSVVVFASLFGVAATQQGVPQSEVDVTLKSPFPLLEHVQHFLHISLLKATLFSSTANLTLTTSYIGNLDFFVLVSNPELREQTLKLVCKHAATLVIEEVELDQQEKDQVGYLHQGAHLGNSTATTIAGVDTRLFKVTLGFSTELQFMPYTQPKPSPNGIGLYLRTIRYSIRHEVLLMPTFFQHFSIVVVDSEYLTSRDRLYLERGVWLHSQGLEIRVNASSAINAFPGLRLTRDNFGLYNKTLLQFADLMPKMDALGARYLTLLLHVFTNGSKESDEDFNSTLHYILKLASPLNITVYMLDAQKNPFEVLPLTRTLDSYGLSNMSLILNLARLINYGEQAKYDSIIKGRSGMLHLSAPAWDNLGIGYATNLSLNQANSTAQAQIQQYINHICSLRSCPYRFTQSLYPLVLDAVHQNNDDIIADILFLEGVLLD